MAAPKLCILSLSYSPNFAASSKKAGLNIFPPALTSGKIASSNSFSLDFTLATIIFFILSNSSAISG